MIRLDNVRRVFGFGANQVTAVCDVSLDIPRGAFCALAGPSGSGKSTLLQLIGGLDTPTSGRIWVNTKLLTSLTEAQLSEVRLREIGFVFQGFNLSPMLSAWENVEFPMLFRRELSRRTRRDTVARVLDSVGLAKMANRRPAELSGGEKQRVAIARALAGEPSVLIADEPTANLDQDTGTAIVRLMRELTRDRGGTCIFSTHDPALMCLADSVLEIRDGRIRNSAVSPEAALREWTPQECAV